MCSIFSIIEYINEFLCQYKRRKKKNQTDMLYFHIILKQMTRLYCVNRFNSCLSYLVISLLSCIQIYALHAFHTHSLCMMVQNWFSERKHHSVVCQQRISIHYTSIYSSFSCEFWIFHADAFFSHWVFPILRVVLFFFFFNNRFDLRKSFEKLSFIIQGSILNTSEQCQVMKNIWKYRKQLNRTSRFKITVEFHLNFFFVFFFRFPYYQMTTTEIAIIVIMKNDCSPNTHLVRQTVTCGYS